MIIMTALPIVTGFTPSGVLVKAVMLHSGSRMALFNGGESLTVSLSSPPDFMQGYGRVSMETAMPLAGVITGMDLFVDDLRSISQGQSIVYDVDISSFDRPLK